ncbi:sterol desaturase family protein [uncultured Roseobacter sp.]|uniref:sterol desaturase family protein n=1 Tax=uncultured Roseobacter sp. TaxID=114847 RepID=UPI0026063DAC|nr:sterol desaturase family protein [uncultured Roseobacter sp.]
MLNDARTAGLPDSAETREAGRWNFRPQVPLAQNPLFQWPPRPAAIFRWYAAFWLEISTTTLCFVLALAAYFVILPELAEMQVLAWGGVIKVWLANLVPQVICAGTLHYWLIMRKGQGEKTKYDPRDQARNNGTFTFGNQVHDNMFWHIASGITLWTAAQVLVFWAMANGYAPVMLFPGNPVWFVAFFVLLPIWSSFHFYWVHRLLHWPPLYKAAHALHHRNVNVGPWSGISMHPIEHLLFYTNFAIHFVVPSHPLHVLFHGYVQSTHPVFSHSGFEEIIVGDKRQAKAGVFFHQLHHRYFECNYGTVEMPWDRWFGSYHDGSAQATDETRARKKQMYT